MDRFSRTRMLLGEKALEKLASSRVAVFGVGGVGGYTLEALVRSGIGAVDIIDNDKVSESNINRQIIALTSTIGRDKVDVAEERILDINPDCKVAKHKCFFLPETSKDFDFTLYDYVVDAIDTITAKIELVKKAQEANVPIISSMGAGNKLDGTRFKVADIYDTKTCPLARKMRQLCKNHGIKSLKVVYSEEQPLDAIGFNTAAEPGEKPAGKQRFPGSVGFVPSVAGLIIAGEVIKDLIKQ